MLIRLLAGVLADIAVRLIAAWLHARFDAIRVARSSTY